MICINPKFGAFGILGFVEVKYFYKRRFKMILRFSKIYKHNMIHKYRNETFEFTID